MHTYHATQNWSTIDHDELKSPHYYRQPFPSVAFSLTMKSTKVPARTHPYFLWRLAPSYPVHCCHPNSFQASALGDFAQVCHPRQDSKVGVAVADASQVAPDHPSLAPRLSTQQERSMALPSLVNLFTWRWFNENWLWNDSRDLLSTNPG